jgi:hypothetical protein
MLSIVLDAESLGQVLNVIGPPVFTEASCVVEDDHLAIRLVGLKSGVKVFGRALGTIDAEFQIRAKRLDAHRIQLDWQLGPVGGLPAAMVRMIAQPAVVQPMIDGLLDELGIEAAVESDQRTMIVHLDRIQARNGLMTKLSVKRFDIPGARGQALSASLDIDATAAVVTPQRSRHKA